MREIKFRVRNDNNKIVAYEYLLSCDDGSSAQWYYRFVAIQGQFLGVSGICGRREQCIGRKDKNEKEIYKDDIIKIKCTPSINLVVVWSEKYGCFQFKGKHSEHWNVYDNYGMYKVIGNIWENPKLLKGGKE